MTHALAIDTSSEVLSLALMKDDRPAGRHYESVGRTMNRTILSVIDGMLQGAGLTAGDLEVIIAARGPGSFTGTRIGLALARSFAQVGRLPLVGVDSLRILAAQAAPEEGGKVHAALNCARDEVFHACYRWKAGELEAEGEIRISSFAMLGEITADAPVVLRRFPPQQAGHEAALAALRPAALRHPQPDATLLMAQGMAVYRAGGPFPPAEPIYLKSEAFRKWKA